QMPGTAGASAPGGIIADRLPDRDRPHRLGDIVNADDLGAAGYGGQRRGDRAAEAASGIGSIRQPADEALARGAEQHRAAERVERGQPVQELEIVPDRLAEADARIDDD